MARGGWVQLQKLVLEVAWKRSHWDEAVEDLKIVLEKPWRHLNFLEQQQTWYGEGKYKTTPKVFNEWKWVLSTQMIANKRNRDKIEWPSSWRSSNFSSKSKLFHIFESSFPLFFSNQLCSKKADVALNITNWVLFSFGKQALQIFTQVCHHIFTNCYQVQL